MSLGIFGVRRRFSITRDELRKIAVERAAETLRDVQAAIAAAGLGSSTDEETRAGFAQTLLPVAYAIYSVQLAQAEHQHEVHEDPLGGDGPLGLGAFPGSVRIPPLAITPLPIEMERHPFSPMPGGAGGRVTCLLCGLGAEHVLHQPQEPS